MDQVKDNDHDMGWVENGIENFPPCSPRKKEASPRFGMKKYLALAKSSEKSKVWV